MGSILPTLYNRRTGNCIDNPDIYGINDSIGNNSIHEDGDNNDFCNFIAASAITIIAPRVVRTSAAPTGQSRPWPTLYREKYSKVYFFINYIALTFHQRIAQNTQSQP